jgi:2-methylcitrate dehydratase PrpD
MPRVTAAGTLAEFAAGLRFESIPPPVVHAAKRQVLDTIGVSLAASAIGAASPVVEAVRAWAGAREASVIGHDFGAPAPHAALANGTLAHALDFDDTHVSSVVHASAFVVPAALAVAEECGAGGDGFLAACVAGYEVATRIGAAAPGRFHARGLHPTGICGPFGAATTAGVLWGLGTAELTSALGIAGSQSSGLLASIAGGAETKRFHAGWAVHGGLIAADLARRGLGGPATIFEGPSGLLDAMLAGETPDPARLCRGLGAEWETARIAIKPYPACHFLHAFMDAAARLGVRAGDVEEITCHVAAPIVPVVCEPVAGRASPASTYAAQFSLPFAVASAIVGGREGLELFGAEARADKRVLGLAERVRYVVDDAHPFPDAYGGRITVHLRDGRVREGEEPVNRGHPDRPLSDDEVVAKFVSNARRRLDAGAVQKIVDTVWRLEEVDTVEELAALAQVS